MRKSSFVGLLIASLATTVVSIFAIMAWIIKNDNVNTLPFMGTITDSKNIEIEEYIIFNDNYLRVAKPSNISNFYIKNGNSYETATSYSDETTYYFKTSKGKYQTCYLEYETVEYYNNMEDIKIKDIINGSYINLKLVLGEINDFLYEYPPSGLTKNFPMFDLYIEVFEEMKRVTDVIVKNKKNTLTELTEALSSIKSKTSSLSKDYLKYLEYVVYKC